jgi:MipA family protein
MHEDMRRILPSRLTLLWAATGLLAALGAAAQAPAEQPREPPRNQQPEQPPMAPESPTPPAPQPSKPDIEGAIGPMFTFRPEFQGAARSAIETTPGIFLRWGRFTLTNASGFVTRRDDDVMRGLAADLVRSERWRVNLSLRLDRGRSNSDSAALTGLQSVQRTVRGRLLVSRALDDGWTVSLGTSTDLLGRGGGTLLDLGLGKAFPLAPKATWSIGIALTAADRRYMDAYFGVTPQQAATTAYAAYSPGAGWRDASVGIGARSEFGRRWIGYVGLSRSELLGPARASPLSAQDSSWAINGGIAWRF